MASGYTPKFSALRAEPYTEPPLPTISAYAPDPLLGKMAFRDNRITAPELDQFIVATVELTGRVLGAGAYGSVEEVEIPGATVAAKKLHQQLVNLGSPQQVATLLFF